MLKAQSSPLECFALSYQKEDKMCQACPHAANCSALMGTRLERIAVGQAKFELLPAEFNPLRRWEEPDAERRDIEETYAECYRQVFGEYKIGKITSFEERIVKLAKAASLPIRTFILVNMFAHSQTFPDKRFTPGTLVDNRAVYRAKTYAKLCTERYGAVSSQLLDVISGGDLADYDLGKRMLDSEVKAATWVIDFKLWHFGQPYEAMFADIENQLDPGWLATEQRYYPILERYTVNEGPLDAATKQTRHEALAIYKRFKQFHKYRHEAMTYFEARERIMVQAVEKICHDYGYSPGDFELPNKPVSDPLLFWNRLALALQHLECLMFVNYREGIYAKP